MPSTLTVKLRTAMLADPVLPSLLGTRIYPLQLTPGSAFPAIVLREVSTIPNYAAGGRLPISRVRVQFTIWEGYVPDDTEAVLTALRNFLATFAADKATPPGYPTNNVINEFDALNPETQPPVYQRVVEAFFFNNDSV